MTAPNDLSRMLDAFEKALTDLLEMLPTTLVSADSPIVSKVQAAEVKVQATRAEIVAHVAAMREALEPFAKTEFHDRWCDTTGDIPFPCDCGAEERLAKVRSLLAEKLDE